MAALRLAAVAWLVLATGIAAGAVPVRFNLVPPASHAGARAVDGELSLRVTSAEETKRVAVRVPGSVELELERGTYVIGCTAAGWWCTPQLIQVRAADIVDMPLRRSGTVAGRIVFAGEPAREVLAVRFEDAWRTGDPACPDRQDCLSSTSGEARCSSDGPSFRCVLPEGKLDLRIAVPGHVPHYVSAMVTSGKTYDLGSLRVVRGASVSGVVRPEEGSPRKVQVTLSPMDRKQKSITARPAENGTFVIGPVPPGDYTVAASLPGLVGRTYPLSVREALEARLREPLVLSKPRTLRVNISPLTDPLGEGWIVTLARDAAVVAEGLAAPDGSWSAGDLAGGDYQLRVRPKRGPLWHYEDITLTSAHTERQVTVKATRFRANVALDGQPLKARLTFNGEHSIDSIPFDSNEKGEARGYLPVQPDGKWVVTVKSADPPVHTTREIDARIDDDGVAVFEIELANATIEGQVVDGNGKPAARALITVAGQDGRGSQSQLSADEEGRFVLRGLQHGRYAISASGYLEESETAEIELKEGTDRAELRLQLKPYRHWHGRVTTPDGQPVREAKVFAIATDVPTVAAHPARTDRDGRFAALTPATANDFNVVVEPRGHSFSFFRRPFSEELNIVVDPRGGTMVIDFDGSKGMEAFLWHRGSALPAYSLIAGWQAELEQPAPGTTRLRIPQLEPGQYTVCLQPTGTDLRIAQPAGDCKTLYLAPFATETVVLRAATSTSSSPSSRP